MLTRALCKLAVCKVPPSTWVSPVKVLAVLLNTNAPVPRLVSPPVPLMSLAQVERKVVTSTSTVPQSKRAGPSTALPTSSRP